MAAHSSQETHSSSHAQGGNLVIQWLERMDNWAHVVVAAFFILMATTVMIHIGYIFVQQMKQITTINNVAPAVQTTAVAGNKPDAAMPPASPSTEEKAMTAAPGKPSAVMVPASSSPAENMSATEETPAQTTADPFVKYSLELLSNILFVVILLELLRTIITYLETHDIQAIMQEFLVVGIISSVRKILLVGAEASLRQGATQTEFIQEASGVVIDILGILLLIGGLVMLKRAFGTRVQKELQEV